MKTLVKPIKIGKVTLKNNLILAPLAGYTDIAFRKIALEEGVGLAITEMVSVKGLLFASSKTEELLALSELEKPSAVQLFGENPEDFKKLSDTNFLDSFDIIDINMGCPMPKITKNGAGSALLGNVVAAAGIVENLRNANKTVTVKVRLGIHEADIDKAIAYCRAMQDAGAYAITVHGRTAKQLYSGLADWDAIGAIAAKMQVPVFGNGDVITPQDALLKLKNYPVSGLMIGRGAIARPDIFKRIQSLAHEEEVSYTPLKHIILRHIRYTQSMLPERYANSKLIKHFAYYLKGIPNIKELKMVLLKAKTTQEMITAIESAEF